MASTVKGAVSDVGKGSLLSAMRGQFPNLSSMAKALGVTPRTAQRWYTKGAEQRSPSKKIQDKMKGLLPALGHVRGEFYFDTPGFRSSPDTRDRDITFTITAEEMARIQGASNEQEAREAFFEAYGMAAPDEVIGADFTISPA